MSSYSWDKHAQHMVEQVRGQINSLSSGVTFKAPSDGGSSDYYELPEGATQLMDLIAHKQMSFAQGNIFKATYRLGEKDGVSMEYDLRKIIYFAQDMLARLRK